jgi:hypothetical protein
LKSSQHDNHDHVRNHGHTLHPDGETSDNHVTTTAETSVTGTLTTEASTTETSVRGTVTTEASTKGKYHLYTGCNHLTEHFTCICIFTALKLLATLCI